MKNQEDLRNKFILYLTKSGVKQKYISVQTGVRECVLSQFKKGIVDLKSFQYEALDKYLNIQTMK